MPRLLIPLIISAVGLGASLVAAQQPSGRTHPTLKREAARPIQSVEGKDLYGAYCAVCHGRDGTGNGPAVPALKVLPPDLTRLAARNGGRFSSVGVTQMILGNGKPLAAHGSTEMPIWGPIFRAMGDDGLRTLRVANLVDYIASLQGT